MSNQARTTQQVQKTAHAVQARKSTSLDQRVSTQSVDGLQLAMTDPRTASSTDVLRLQRVAGNRATARLIQTKLSVGPAGDQYEQEADRVAEQVMRMPAPAQQQPAVQRQAAEEEEVQMKPLAASITPLVQRQAEEEDEEIQAKPIVQRQAEEEDEEIQAKPIVQRQAEEEEEIQTKPVVQRASMGAGFEASGEFEQRLAASRGGGRPLPDGVRSFMEPRFGADFSGVRVHTGSEAAQLNRTVSAQAFTHGQDIYLGEGKTDITSSEGKRLLAHELTHTIQQTGGSLKRKTDNLVQRNGKDEVSLHDDPTYKDYPVVQEMLEKVFPGGW